MTLWMLVRNNFIANEARIVDQEGGSSAFPTGTLHWYAGSSAPTGFLLCDGSVVSRTTYADLFAIVGTSFNTGGESGTQFRLPGLLGRSVIGNGAGASLTARTIGQSSGAETHTLTATDTPTHTHAKTDPEHKHKLPSQADDTSGAQDFAGNYSFVGGLGASGLTLTSATTGMTIGDAGSGGSHNNMQPSLALKAIIKT